MTSAAIYFWSESQRLGLRCELIWVIGKLLVFVLVIFKSLGVKRKQMKQNEKVEARRI